MSFRNAFILLLVFTVGGSYIARQKQVALESRIEVLKKYKHDADSVNEANKKINANLDTNYQLIISPYKFKKK